MAKIIKNESTVRLPTLNRILSWLEARDTKGLRDVAFKFALTQKEMSGGCAHSSHEDGIPYLVEIDVSSRRVYPKIEQHAALAPLVPAVTLESLEDEVLFLLAHEIGHVRQFRGEAPIWIHPHNYPEMELDAERYAIRMLGSWKADGRGVANYSIATPQAA